MKTTIANVTQGVIPDQPDEALPDGAWTMSRNVRYKDGGVEKMKGYRDAMNSASATPIWCEPVSDGLTTFWVYGSETRLYATDGSLHADVSSITYTAQAILGYTGGAFHGYMVANDAVNPPQVWSPALANKFQEISHWPATTVVDVVRPFGDFLVGLRWNESGTYNARLIRWSDKAAAGTMPGSWDYTDPTNQAGRTELGQTHDELVDCTPLRDSNIVYKRFHTWIMSYVGGLDVFAFRELFKECGLLTEGCAKSFGPRQFAVTDNDVIVHDGNDAQSIADKRLRRWLFNSMSVTRFEYSFVAADYREREMWFCFPEEGYDFPNLAAVWDWADNSWSIRELGEQMLHASNGVIEASGVTFDEDPGEFDNGPVGTFDEYDYAPWAQRLLFASATRPQLIQGNTTYQWAGRTFPIWAMRTNMALTKDVNQVKRVSKIWPKIIGGNGETVKFRVGASDHYEGAISFNAPVSFTVGTDYRFGCRVTGRFIHLYIEYTGDKPLKLVGFDVEFDHRGHR